VDYLKTQIEKLPIDLRLGQEVTLDFVKQLGPARVLLAQGAKRQAPPIPGVDRRNVFTGDDLRELLTGAGGRTSQKLSLGQRALVAGGGLLGITRNIDMIRKMSKLWMPLGKRTVIVGGGLVGVELAGFLAERGLRVTVLEEKDYLAPEMSLPRRWRVLYDLRKQGVSMLTGVQIEEILDQGVAFVNKDGIKETEAAESVILATGAMPNQGLFDQLGGLGFETDLIGDCREIGYIEGAMADGARMGRQI
jgi:NADPH-dependent 2,4-dienoyl-CoA reductase/sulfur reductase-like enzyme